MNSLPDDSDLVGKIGIANAKLAYREYQKIFASDLNDNTRFFSLNTIGAQPQRPLWASTSVKNPEYPPTLYFDSLLGADTVNNPSPTNRRRRARHRHHRTDSHRRRR